MPTPKRRFSLVAGTLAMAASVTAFAALICADVAEASAPKPAVVKKNVQQAATQRIEENTQAEVPVDPFEEPVSPPTKTAKKKGKRVDFGHFEGY